MAWARWQSPWWLLLPAAGSLARAFRGPGGRALNSLAALLLILGTLAGFGHHLRYLRWGDPNGSGAPVFERPDSMALSRGLEDPFTSGPRAVRETLDALADPEAGGLQEKLSRIRRGSGITALAVYDDQGRPRAWVGVHRGPVPEEIRAGDLEYAFGGGPLFRYLYFTARETRSGATVVAAVLLQTNLPAGLEDAGFAARFQRRYGVPIKILPPARARGDVIFDLNMDGEPLLSITPGRQDPEEVWRAEVGIWIRWMSILSLLTWAFLTLGMKGTRTWVRDSTVSLLALVLLLPTDGFWFGSELASPAHFLMPLVAWPLGKVLVVVIGLVLLCGFLTERVRGRFHPGVAAAILALGYPALDLLFRKSASPVLFSVGVQGWLPYQVSLALAMALLACVALAGTRGEPEAGLRPLTLVLAGALGLGLSFAGALWARSNPGLPSWYLFLWGIPAFIAAWGGRGWVQQRRSSLWMAAALLGSLAALPSAWGTSLQARMAVAETELTELGAEPDPYLEFRLLRLATTADSLDQIIASPVELLFEVWSETGQGGDPLPMWLTLWSPGNYPEDLAMGVRGDRPAYADDYLDLAREGGVPIVRHLGLSTARYLLLVPLSGRRVLTAVVPPLGSMSLNSPMGPIFSALGRGATDAPSILRAGPADAAGAGEDVVWERRPGGWQGRRVLRYIDGALIASRLLVLPGTLHLVARGTLNLVLDLTLVLLLLGLGRLLARGGDVRPGSFLRVMGSFRARVTLALFGFFVLSVAIFGTLAFQTLQGAAQRTASALAERIVEDGANFYNDAQGVMQLLAQRVGAELLEYKDGELAEGSADELVQLGLYEGWIPEPTYRAIEEGREIRPTLRSSLGGWQYLIAFRRLPDGDILATPVPVEAGATALGRQEVADLLGFAIVLGAVLSLGLALLVGRTLSRPIETLQVASERVGAGNLKVRLPEDRKDEFGSVFGAFNRMVRRIRRARRALLRTTRRTQAIVEEVATGVVALDAGGRVTLVNPRAESLLGVPVHLGETLTGREGEPSEMIHWLDLYFRDGLQEASKEFQMGARRIRIRARRVSEEGPIGGAVLSMEDVTDELRSERILAWGEMARQVAHEVKNPLTPIKLSVQHLQRAWEDRRPDFHSILARNVDVILREIEHLAAIARSFSRFGAPQASGDLPLDAVSIRAVAEEVMDLYGGGKGALSFLCEVPAEIPAVRAREAELREVLINLLENARAAIPNKGEVIIEAETIGPEVELRVRDNGSGIESDLLTRIFEPHFSTRSMGTGLGLAIVRRLVESWGGSINAESTVGKGTVMKIRIPAWMEVQEDIRGEGEGDSLRSPPTAEGQGWPDSESRPGPENGSTGEGAPDETEGQKGSNDPPRHPDGPKGSGQADGNPGQEGR